MKAVQKIGKTSVMVMMTVKKGGHSTFFEGVNHLHGQWVLNVDVLPVESLIGMDCSACSLIKCSFE